MADRNTNLVKIMRRFPELKELVNSQDLSRLIGLPSCANTLLDLVRSCCSHSADLILLNTTHTASEVSALSGKRCLEVSI